MKPLQHLLGREHDGDFVNRALRDFVQQHQPPVVGALHVTCSDECEREAVESFQHWFAEPLLPELKFASKSPFRTANIGARYEWNSARFTEEHFATPESEGRFKVLLVKVHSHVAIDDSLGPPVYGKLLRYGRPSALCGRLQWLLDGGDKSAGDDLREAFESEGKPRVEMLCDAEQVPPRLQNLYAGIVNARLQARRAIVDIQDYRPVTPTLYLVVPCVSVNRPRRDTELVVGAYLADTRQSPPQVRYQGLGDDPSGYEFTSRHGLAAVSDEHLHQPRDARDHRVDVLNLWRLRRTVDEWDRGQLEEAARRAEAARREGDAKLLQESLVMLLWLLADAAPIPASMVLFARGAAGIHHLYQVHRLARGGQDVRGAEAIIRESVPTVQSLSQEEAGKLLGELMKEYRVGPDTGSGDAVG